MPLLSLLLGLAAAAPASAFSADSDRGLFVYGRLVLDFSRGRETLGHDAPLRNCSTAAFHCADGELFNIVLPRACADAEMRPGRSWRIGSLETSVIGRRDGWDRPSSGGAGDVYYLQTNERPEVVYEYSRREGVTALFYDVNGEVDFPRMARNGDVEGFRHAAAGVPGRDALVMTLITFDRFAACAE